MWCGFRRWRGVEGWLCTGVATRGDSYARGLDAQPGQGWVMKEEGINKGRSAGVKLGKERRWRVQRGDPTMGVCVSRGNADHGEEEDSIRAPPQSCGSG